MRTIPFVLVAPFVAVVSGCPSSPAATSACRDISAACHDVDPGSGPLHDCHELGHDEVESACASERDRCVALCMAAAAIDAGPRTDGGEVRADAPHMH
ncbi:MAG: hypothetical protein OHK0013_23080 [Sandaracinaceae bacterium]